MISTGCHLGFYPKYLGQFKIIQDSNFQSDSHLEVFETCFLYSFPHLWECVWILRHSFNPQPFLWAPDFGCKSKAKATIKQ